MTHKLPNDGSACAFVTREAIDDCIHNDGYERGNLILLRALAIRLLAEREAYREAYVQRIQELYQVTCDCSANHDLEEIRKEADAEAARLLEGKK